MTTAAEKKAAEQAEKLKSSDTQTPSPSAETNADPTSEARGGVTSDNSGVADKQPTEDPAGTADAANGAESRTEAATDAEGNTKALTSLEAQQEAALAARNATNDSSLSPSSESIVNPGPEMRAGLTNDALTAKREQLSKEAATGESVAAEVLVDLFDKVIEKQKALDDAMVARDSARDDYDRAVESSVASYDPRTAVSSYIEAMNAQREKEIPDADRPKAQAK